MQAKCSSAEPYLSPATAFPHESIVQRESTVEEKMETGLGGAFGTLRPSLQCPAMSQSQPTHAAGLLEWAQQCFYWIVYLPPCKDQVGKRIHTLVSSYSGG